MITRSSLSHEQARKAIDDGDFSAEVKSAAEGVILILTQSWCPQWMFMKMSLKGLGKGSGDMNVAVITYEYDTSPLFQEFMAFKEGTFRNWEVPYVRLYKNGKFIAEGNHFPASRMMEALRNG
jgi:hypothetical protein